MQGETRGDGSGCNFTICTQSTLGMAFMLNT